MLQCFNVNWILIDLLFSQTRKVAGKKRHGQHKSIKAQKEIPSINIIKCNQNVICDIVRSFFPILNASGLIFDIASELLYIFIEMLYVSLYEVKGGNPQRLDTTHS